MNDNPSSTPSDTDDAPDQVSTVVRGQAVWTGIYALAALYFGWKGIEPSELLGIRIVRFTLQYGGAGMLLAALVLLSGNPVALLLDGVFGILAGIGLIVGGLLLLQFNVAYGVVCIVFGYLFFSSGRRSMRDHGKLGAPDDPDQDHGEGDEPGVAHLDGESDPR